MNTNNGNPNRRIRVRWAPLQPVPTMVELRQGNEVKAVVMLFGADVRIGDRRQTFVTIKDRESLKEFSRGVAATSCGRLTLE